MDLSLSARRQPLSPAVSKTLTNTFVTVGAMVALTAVTSIASVGVRLSMVAYLVMFAASIGLIFATRALRNSAWGLLALAAFAALQGVVLGPLLAHYLGLRSGGSVIATSLVLTSGATFGCAGYAIASRRDFSQLRGMLFGGLLVLVLASLVGLFFPMPGMQLALAAFGALLFVGYLLLDVGDIVSGLETNYISASLGIFLDVLNLFLSILRLLGIVGDD